jgi:hypothetical protein
MDYGEINETREEYIRRLAQNRYDLRQREKWLLHETDKDDWGAAEEQVRQEEKDRINESSPG